MEIFHQLDDKLGIAEAQKLYGCIYTREQDWDTAAQHFNDSIESYKSCDNSLGLAEVYYEFGLMYQDKQELKPANNYLNDSLKLFEQLKASERIEQVQSLLETLAAS